ncbi:YhcN/YlaJ family sporulation lipoprotein [Mesobacillus campisalis]|uniref:YhcN/YlaJ family sporulation lipoprotein n=1 Tax=Mesobacillus campisalis TaxID=1408103 RepID=UPI0007E35EAE|nr:YhcN/YlaJ family sporulation lipoprotein [Mesobacillus campisalis]
MKKTAAIIGICGFLTAGCAGNMAGDGNDTRGINQRNGNQLHVNNSEPELYNRDVPHDDKRFGYVRHQRTGVMGADQDQPEYEIDREQFADMISRLSTHIPNVDDVSTLVTDEEVLIVYRTEGNDRKETADQVKKTAMSLVPRWYEIYVSDNPNLRQNVENFATLNTNSDDIDSLLEGVIEQMSQSPQGQTGIDRRDDGRSGQSSNKPQKAAGNAGNTMDNGTGYGDTQNNRGQGSGNGTEGTVLDGE